MGILGTKPLGTNNIDDGKCIQDKWVKLQKKLELKITI
jgi:hypothetical protein